MKLADNVYAVLALAHPIRVNAGFVVTDEGVVVIDSGWTHPSALTILGYIEAVASSSQIKYLILTEHHSDHIFGAHVFKANGAQIIAHRLTKEFLESHGEDYVEAMIERNNKPWREAKAMPQGYDFGRTFFQKVEVVLPDRTIGESTELRLGGEELRLIPTPGHLLDCISVYLPRTKILFAGDTIYSGYPPTTRFGDASQWREWIKSLEGLKELEIEVIVPGHGLLCDKSEIEQNIRYLAKLLEEEGNEDERVIENRE
ncbi:MBL fold metallo-hydrolase [Dehalococcoidia bacterium]|nr:MBL fold metallo-hydrolase [Dehalococcoidia bacterium]